MGAAILGVSVEELGRLIDTAGSTPPAAPRLLPERSVDIAVFFDQRTVTTPNVVAYLPGSDPRLKDEYVVIGSHHDPCSDTADAPPMVPRRRAQG